MAAFEVLPVNEKAVDVFIAVQTQWERHPASGRPRGLNYQGVRATFDMMGIDAADMRDLFEALQVMELAALSEFSEGT